MANWQRTLRLQPEWQQATDGEITPQHMAGVIAVRLKHLKPLNDPFVDLVRDELVENFEAFSEDAGADVEEFDWLMSDLYDWGDKPLESRWNGKKVCWIDTTTKP